MTSNTATKEIFVAPDAPETGRVYDFIQVRAGKIPAEVVCNEEIKRVDRGDDQDVAREKARHLAGQMRQYSADSIVHTWQGLEGSFGLPGPNDGHVPAAAVAAGRQPSHPRLPDPSGTSTLTAAGAIPTVAGSSASRSPSA